MSTVFRSRSSRARSARVLSGLNPVDTDWSAFNYYRSKTTHQPNHVSTDWRQTRSSRQRTPSRTPLLRLEWLQERLVASASPKMFGVGSCVAYQKGASLSGSSSASEAPTVPAKGRVSPRNSSQLPPLYSKPTSLKNSIIQERTGHRSLDALGCMDVLQKGNMAQSPRSSRGRRNSSDF